MNTQIEQRTQPLVNNRLSAPTVLALLSALLLPGIYVMLAEQVQPGLLVSEIFFWSVTLLVLVIVLVYERKPLSSIGFVRLTWRGVAWGVAAGLILFILFPVLQALIQLLGLPIASDKAKLLADMPVWGLFLLALRAGVMEEILYRGYPFERILAITGSKAVAALVPLLVFVITHLNWGAGHLLFVTMAGGILTLVYLWKRNLWINVIAHFVVDFAAFMMIPFLLEKQG